MTNQDDCTLCILTTEHLDKLHDEDADQLAVSIRDDLCSKHLLAWVAVRKITNSTGKDQLREMLRISEGRTPSSRRLSGGGAEKLWILDAARKTLDRVDPVPIMVSLKPCGVFAANFQ